MTLHEFLCCCNPDDYVGIWDIDTPVTKKHKSRKRFEEQPTEQNYFKIKNIPYGRIYHKLDKDVFIVNHTEKGFLIRIHTKDKTTKSLDQWDLARKIATEMKR